GQASQSGEQAKRQAAALDRLQSEGDAECGEDARPGEVRQSEDRVKRAELWHSQVQALGLVAEDHRMAERPDHETKTQAEREKEKCEDARRAVLDEVTDGEPAARHERKSSQAPRQVKHQGRL